MRTRLKATQRWFFGLGAVVASPRQREGGAGGQGKGEGGVLGCNLVVHIKGYPLTYFCEASFTGGMQAAAASDWRVSFARQSPHACSFWNGGGKGGMACWRGATCVT